MGINVSIVIHVFLLNAQTIMLIITSILLYHFSRKISPRFFWNSSSVIRPSSFSLFSFLSFISKSPLKDVDWLSFSSSSVSISHDATPLSLKSYRLETLLCQLQPVTTYTKIPAAGIARNNPINTKWYSNIIPINLGHYYLSLSGLHL